MRILSLVVEGQWDDKSVRKSLLQEVTWPGLPYNVPPGTSTGTGSKRLPKRTAGLPGFDKTTSPPPQPQVRSDLLGLEYGTVALHLNQCEGERSGFCRSLERISFNMSSPQIRCLLRMTQRVVTLPLLTLPMETRAWLGFSFTLIATAWPPVTESCASQLLKS